MARFCVFITLAVCCLITGSNGSKTWLSRDCSDNSQCPAARNSTCFSSQCVCTPGYYYSSSQGMCVKECPSIDPWTGFVEYLYNSINVSNIYQTYKDNEKMCWTFCTMKPGCRAVVYNFQSGECTIPAVTAVGLSSDRWFKTGYTATYVKQCM